jgi:hypothetical protein
MDVVMALWALTSPIYALLEQRILVGLARTCMHAPSQHRMQDLGPVELGADADDQCT